jgi:hypothetical protein
MSNRVKTNLIIILVAMLVVPLLLSPNIDGRKQDRLYCENSQHTLLYDGPADDVLTHPNGSITFTPQNGMSAGKKVTIIGNFTCIMAKSQE